jgi:hypothetical protein
MSAKPKPLIKVMLDSGAYSAWRQSGTIAIDDYIRFVRDVEPCVHTYVNLDVIPGALERPRTWNDTQASADASYRNLQKMKDAGLRPLPVFHQGEDFKWLEKMLADGEDYIGISSAKNQRPRLQQQWLDIFFATVTDELGRPLIKVHGFGSAHVDWLQRYPFYSVDTSGWIKAAIKGKIYVPPYGPDGLPNYLGPPELVTITSKFRKSKYAQTRQLTNPTYYGPEAVAAFRHFIEHECGLTLEQVQTEHWARAQALALYYERVRTALPDRICFHPRVVLRPDERRVAQLLKSSRSAIKLPPLQFVFATQNQKPWCQVLLAVGARYHLLSYWKLKKPEVLAAYAMGGKVVAKLRTEAAEARSPVEAE